MDSHTFPTGIYSDQSVIPLRSDILADKHVRYRVITSVNLYMSIGMDSPGTDLKETEAFRCQRPECRFFHFQKMTIDLFPRCAMDTQPGDGPVPAGKMGIQFF